MRQTRSLRPNVVDPTKHAWSLVSAMVLAGGCGDPPGGAALSAESGASVAASSAPPPPPPVATSALTPARPAAISAAPCVKLQVRNARDARGAPLWGNSSDLMGGGAAAAPFHVVVGTAVSAPCKTDLGGKGLAVCLRDPAGQVGWMHHDRLIEAADTTGSLAKIRALPACPTDGSCAPQGCLDAQGGPL